MPSRAQAHRRQRARARRRMEEPARAARRARRLALGVLVSTITLLVLMVSAFSGNNQAGQPLPPAGSSQLLPSGRPAPIVVARITGLNVYLPIARGSVTAIGYHAAEGMLALDPEGTRANEGLLARLLRHITGGGGSGIHYYQLSGGSGPATSALDVGAAPGTDVYAPVSGTVTGIGDFIINGNAHGVLLDIRPTSAPSLVLEMSGLRLDPSVAIGTTLVAGASRLGSVVDLASVEQQALAHYTQDRGDHVTISFEQGSTPVLP